MYTPEYHVTHATPLKVGGTLRNRRYRGPLNPPTQETLLHRCEERKAASRGTCPKCSMQLTPTGCPYGC